ncbi:MAG: methanethiol S-methyltransferase [Mizugakiibacter sp.]|uniref:methanethiol S-methyltransferase n=1 Tax=Mizugakiibacter sp. TaxID=1972610 RepID=UPI0031BCF21F|nr:isoprenylcysteine carboxylmethyltransferase family protein [Xanthomonadaceae bacterium]
MRGVLYLLYGTVCYIVFFLTFLYAIAFVGDFLAPYTVDRGRAAPTAAALAIDLILLGVFAVQHSGMARRGFKRWLTGWLPEPMERSTYVLVSSAALILLYWQWRPLPALVWEVQVPWSVDLLYALSAAGWLLVLTGTFLIDHFDLFGLRQVWLRARGRAYTPLAFKRHLYYRLVRHPLMLGFVVAFWATPRMTAGHLLFAAAATGYILVAVKFLEERDLVAMHGEDYRRYQREVPMLCPWPRPRQAARASGPRPQTQT